jgi:hypothetical protein
MLLRPAKLRKRELIRYSTVSDYKSPNHPPKLAAKVEKCPRWKRWITALERAEKGTL